MNSDMTRPHDPHARLVAEKSAGPTPRDSAQRNAEWLVEYTREVSDSYTAGTVTAEARFEAVKVSYDRALDARHSTWDWTGENGLLIFSVAADRLVSMTRMPKTS